MRTKTYKQLNQKEREKIYQLKKKGLTNSDIAQKLSRDKSTIGRELQRNQHFKLKHYLPDTAERKAQKRKEKGRKARYADKHPKLKRKIILLLGKGWSPDLMAGRLQRNHEPYLNKESIYQFIYSLEGRKQNLRQYLRRAHRIRRKKNGRKHWRENRIPNRVDIIKRPKTVEKRTQFGHWEGDNVLEAAAHEAVTASIGMKFYFAKTYASWQRGTNENRNGLVRFYLPRETDLDTVSDIQIKRVENLINNRPMKCLGYQTPNEAYEFEMNKLHQKSLRKNIKNFYPSVALVN